jgi:tripartite-type tricarboxylate transporter receptor subunit TctC
MLHLRETPSVHPAEIYMHLLGRAIALAAAACGAAPATAPTYPARSIEMIVPFLTGGMTGAVAHAMQNELSKVLGQPVSIVSTCAQ